LTALPIDPMSVISRHTRPSHSIPSILALSPPLTLDLSTAGYIFYVIRAVSRSRIRTIHASNLATDTLPFHVPFDALLAALELQVLIPLHELVDEAEMRLDDDVEAAGADEAAVRAKGRAVSEGVLVGRGRGRGRWRWWW
jgi:hypothetical protein